MTASFGTEIVLKAMDEIGARCILDLGCGPGGFLIDACRRNPRLSGTGLDVSPEIIERGRTRVSRPSASATARRTSVSTTIYTGP